MRQHICRLLGAGLCLALAPWLPAGAAAVAAVAAPGSVPNGELRLRWEGREASVRGPLALAEALLPGSAPAQPERWVTEATLRHTLRGHLGSRPWALGLDLLAARAWGPQGASADASRVNELYAASDAGAWSFSAGRKIVSWDVGHGFRPNDVVQQEQRRTLDGATPQGRPVLMAEHFGTDRALSVVWVRPRLQRDDLAGAGAQGTQEQAWAVRAYQRAGAADAYLFARAGQRTGTSLGAALAWVATDSLGLHASLRHLQRHERWQFDPAAGLAPVAAAPWVQALSGRATQALLGAGWTGAQQQSLLVEAWYDGSAPGNASWDQWTQRNQALAAGPAPAAARAGNLVWNVQPLAGPARRRENLFVRLAWQPGPWTASVDALVTPADRGRVLTAALQWQGDRVRLAAHARHYGGPAQSVLAQLPLRRVGLLSATWAW